VPPSLVGKDFDSKGVFSVPSLGRVSINYEANPIWDDIGSLRGGLLTNYMPAYMSYQTFQWQHFFQRQQASSKMEPFLKQVGVLSMIHTQLVLSLPYSHSPSGITSEAGYKFDARAANDYRIICTPHTHHHTHVHCCSYLPASLMSSPA
jgi:hypothetical protein